MVFKNGEVSMTATVFSVENRKGGVGKTTTAVILATALAKHVEGQGKRVLLMDTDPQGDAATAFDLNAGDRCLSNLLLEISGFAENIMPVGQAADGIPNRPNLFLLPASDKLSLAVNALTQDIGAMREMASKMTNTMRRSSGLDTIPSMADIFERTVAPLKDAFHYIVVDCPPSLGELREAIHRYADYAIVPVRTDYHSVRQTAHHTRNILEDQAKGLNIRILAVVPTFVQKNHLLTREMLDQLKEAYGRTLTEPVPLVTAVAQAPALGGMTVLDHAPDSSAAKAYRKLVERALAA
jgi:chromosome partitioning protein